VPELNAKRFCIGARSRHGISARGKFLLLDPDWRGGIPESRRTRGSLA
jgi:hypothetical protein